MHYTAKTWIDRWRGEGVGNIDIQSYTLYSCITNPCFQWYISLKALYTSISTLAPKLVLTFLKYKLILKAGAVRGFQKGGGEISNVVVFKKILKN